MKLKQNPDYIPLTQQDLCCVPTTIQWVLVRRNLPLVSQEDIGKVIGLHVPKEKNHLFMYKFPNTKAYYGTYGTELNNKNLNELFEKYKLPLVGEYTKISKIKDPHKFIIENMKAGNDVCMMFHKKNVTGENWAHGSILAEYDTDTKTITVGDPSPRYPKFWKVKLTKMVDAMNTKWDGNERGFWVIKSK